MLGYHRRWLLVLVPGAIGTMALLLLQISHSKLATLTLAGLVPPPSTRLVYPEFSNKRSTAKVMKLQVIKMPASAH